MLAGADFRAFHAEKARVFKKHLAAAKNPRTGKPLAIRRSPLAAGTVDGTLRDLKAFFVWLADQAGYRSQLSHADAAYFSPSRRTAKSVRGGLWRPHPSPEQALHTLRTMPSGTAVERRDRAILAMLLLTGARDGSLIALQLRDVDLHLGCIHLRGIEAGTKFGKVFSVWFFPVGDEVRRIAENWIADLKRNHLFGPGDPVFPKQKVGIGRAGGFEAQGLDRAPWADAAKLARIVSGAFAAVGLPPATTRRPQASLASFRSHRSACGSRTSSTQHMLTLYFSMSRWFVAEKFTKHLRPEPASFLQPRADSVPVCAVSQSWAMRFASSKAALLKSMT
jgi:integrase